MTIAAGTRLGSFEILSLLGAGGMGEVYRAKDLKLDRDVAIKVIPEDFLEGEENKQRFEREARVLASLNHPGIAAIYSFEEISSSSSSSSSSAPRHLIVMELVEGETMSARLAKGPIPLEQLLPIGTQIADALDRAHRQGIVHRDLKPANVMLTKSGVKLLDFGLAKTLAPQAAPTGLTSLPTMASPQHLTQQGTILGTFQYMSPEQLEGSEADARSDIFAFGAVLFEMATGKRAFDGKSQASLIGSILKDTPPPASSIAPMTPPALDRVIGTCLAKDPDDRFQTAHDVRLQLQWIAEGGSQAGVPAPVVQRRRSRERLAWTIAAAALALAAGLSAIVVRAARKPERIFRSSLPPPEGTNFWLEANGPGPIVVSPDGRQVAFTAADAAGKINLYVRALDAREARMLSGTEAAMYPFWSPDGRSLGFFTSGKLKTIEASGGSPQTICGAPEGKGATWSPAGIIVFTPGPTSPLFKVSEKGGETTAVTKIDGSRGDDSHRHPRFLPDGKHFLYVARSTKTGSEGHYVVAASLDGGAEKVLLRSPAAAVYASGNLLYLRETTLMARPFDAARLAFTGEAFPVAERILMPAIGTAIGGLLGLAERHTRVPDRARRDDREAAVVHARREAGRDAGRSRGLPAGPSLAGRQAGRGDHPGPGDRDARPLDLRHRPGRAHALYVRSRRGRVAALVPGRIGAGLRVQSQGTLRPLPQGPRRLLGGRAAVRVGRRQVSRHLGAWRAHSRVRRGRPRTWDPRSGRWRSTAPGSRSRCRRRSSIR